jgi:hypothetical protein
MRKHRAAEKCLFSSGMIDWEAKRSGTSGNIRKTRRAKKTHGVT